MTSDSQLTWGQWSGLPASRTANAQVKNWGCWNRSGPQSDEGQGTPELGPAIPEDVVGSDAIAPLRRELREANRREDHELAATLKDKIQRPESQDRTD